MITVNQVKFRCNRNGVDASGLGRWSWSQYAGRDGSRVRVVSAYRPCRAPPGSKLTTVWDQHQRYLHKIQSDSNPRQQFDQDLKSLFLEWIQQNIRIVLCIDANENVLDGDFNTIMIEIGLINAHHQYGTEDLPPTPDCGSTPISAIYVSATLVPTQLGILAHGEGIEGDHRNMYLDFDQRNFLGDDLHIIPPSEKRRLQLKDTRIVCTKTF